MKKVVFLIMMVFLIGMGKSNKASNEIYRSDHLKIIKLSGGTFVHESYLATKDFGNVPCNG